MAFELKLHDGNKAVHTSYCAAELSSSRPAELVQHPLLPDRTLQASSCRKSYASRWKENALYDFNRPAKHFGDRRKRTMTMGREEEDDEDEEDEEEYAESEEDENEEDEDDENEEDGRGRKRRLR